MTADRTDAKVQKNMRWPPALRATFELWCHSRGYNEQTVLGAGFLALAKQSPAVREAMIREFRQWEEQGYPSPSER